MDTNAIVAALDKEIAALESAKQLLSIGFNKKPAKHGMSLEGRARVAAAQRKRWAKQKKAA